MLLLVLLAAYLAVLRSFFPVDSETETLIRDAKSGTVSTVYYRTDGVAVYAEWSPSLLEEKSATYRSVYGLPNAGGVVEEFETRIQHDAGRPLTFRQRDATYGFGPLDMVFAPGYYRLIPWPWLKAATVAACSLIIVVTLTRRRMDRADRVLWAFAEVATGFGLVAALWRLPAPLVQVRRRGAGEPGPPAGGVIILRSTAVAAIALIALAVCYVAVR